ncbi:MAG TPA: hypothetical protein VII75_12515 [Thermoanaerobaculia bacterium]
MPYVFVFAAGFVMGRGWHRVRDTVAPVLRDASQRFDALYAEAARAVAQKAEDVDDRIAERRWHASSEVPN